jgi:DNA modification methylase
MKINYKTDLGKYYLGDSKELLASELGEKLRGKVQLIITSPPFPLNNKKSYGNLNGREYKKWFSNLAPIFSNLLKENGSVVIELGNAWEKNRPVQSLLHLESLIAFAKNKEAKLSLCQQFVCYNPSRLPSPAQWVTINHIRTTDSYTHVWWFGKTDHPKADTGKVLRPYSKSMKGLLKRQKYNSGKRPSEHSISENGFLKDHGGSIPQNFFELEPLDKSRDVRLPNAFSLSNTNSNDDFLRACRENGIVPHPARMPEGLISFFVQFLSDPGDIVLDPFAGSNTTGYIAEKLKRNWVGIEINESYLSQAKLRFENKQQSLQEKK